MRISTTTDQEYRSKQYESLLDIADKDIFISGVSMSGLITNSLHILESKLDRGFSVKVLLADPLFVEQNCNLFQYNDNLVEEIKMSLNILGRLGYEGLEIRLYSNFMPITVTGFTNDDEFGSLAYEITDYYEGSPVTVYTVQERYDDSIFNSIKSRFDFYWNESEVMPVK